MEGEEIPLDYKTTGNYERKNKLQERLLRTARGYKKDCKRKNCKIKEKRPRGSLQERLQQNETEGRNCKILQDRYQRLQGRALKTEKLQERHYNKTAIDYKRQTTRKRQQETLQKSSPLLDNQSLRNSYCKSALPTHLAPV